MGAPAPILTFSRLSVLGGLAVLAAGCTSALARQAPAGAPSTTPGQFLKWSMDQYAAMPTFQTQMKMNMSSPGSPAAAGGPEAETRQIAITAPNRFKVVTNMRGKPFMYATSDGKTVVEYSTEGGQGAQSYPAPAKISSVSSMMMRHPMFCGTLLYQFFGGSANFGGLVDESKGALSFGPESTTADGEKARMVKFYGQQTYGHVSALIGEKTGYVYQIQYDSEPLIKMMVEQGQPKMTLQSVEEYSKPIVGAAIPDTTFKANIPSGTTVQSAPGLDDDDKPPIPAGAKAPDFTVSSLGGTKVKLSDLRGQVVMIDFWATWCPPCRKGLPSTAHLAALGLGKGLRVLAISDEPPATIQSFLKKQSYKLNAYVDSGDKAETAYKVSGIPSVLIIDKTGKIVQYFVGLHEESEIRAALKKAGLNIES